MTPAIPTFHPGEVWTPTRAGSRARKITEVNVYRYTTVWWLDDVTSGAMSLTAFRRWVRAHQAERVVVEWDQGVGG